MLQTMLSVSSGANKDTLAACEAVSEALDMCLPPSQNKGALREEIAVKVAGAAEVVRSVSIYVSCPVYDEVYYIYTKYTRVLRSVLFSWCYHMV